MPAALDDWFAGRDDPGVQRLQACRAPTVDNLDPSLVADGIVCF